MRILLATLALLIGLTAAHAQIAGQNDPQFKAALELWLEGEDDLAALTALSGLAKADNRAAQVFLGRVNEATHTHIHVTGPMEHKARIALMRQVGGLSGKSWLKAASQDVPLAVAFLQVKTTWEAPGAIMALTDLGEVTAVMMPIRKLLDNGELAEATEILAHPNLPDHTIYLRAVIAQSNYYGVIYGSILGSGRFINALNWKLSAEEVENIIFMWKGFHRRVVEDGQASPIVPETFPESSINNPYFAPLKALCSARCENGVPQCMRAIMIHQPSYPQIWIALSSPVETLVSTSEYHNSPRMLNDLVRLIRTPTNDSPGYFKGLDQCSYQIMYAD